MNAEQRGLFRIAILRGLAAAAPLALPFATLQDLSRMAGFADVPESELKQELDYLVKKGLAEEKENPFSAGQKKWEITAEGREMLEREGLI